MKNKSYKYMIRSSMHTVRKASDDKDLIWQLLVAVVVLALVSFLVAAALLLTEGRGRESEFSNYWNCLFWTVMTYLGNPSGIGDWTVTTSGGRSVVIVVNIIAFALYAAFTGLFVALIIAWYKNVVRRAELRTIHMDLLRAFHRQNARTLSKKRGHSCYIVPSQKLLATLQVKANIDLKDVMDVANRYYGFRVKNLANMRSMEDQGVTDRFIVEHFPVNRKYGCCLDRGSNVTIVAPASDASVGTGWFSYYLAHFGGFNYISKDYDTDPLHRTSYYNLDDDVKGIAKDRRDEYCKDIEELSSRQNSWFIFVLSYAKSKTSNMDICLTNAKEDGSDSTVKDLTKYREFIQEFEKQLSGYKIRCLSDQFPLKGNNIIYKLNGVANRVNAFTMRIASWVQKADTERLLIVDTMAEIIGRHLNETLVQEVRDKKEGTFPDSEWLSPPIIVSAGTTEPLSE